MRRAPRPDVAILPRGGFVAALTQLAGPVRVDRDRAPLKVATALDEAEVSRVWGEDPCLLPKAQKTEAEIAGTTEAHLRDGAAMLTLASETRSGIDLIKDDELMTDPAYLPLETRVRVATEEIRNARETTGRHTMYAFNITGDLDEMRRRHDLVRDAGGTCVMTSLNSVGLVGMVASLTILGLSSELLAKPDSAGDHPVDFDAAVPLDAGLDLREAGGEVGPARVADDQIADLLGAQPDPVEPEEPDPDEAPRGKALRR